MKPRINEWDVYQGLARFMHRNGRAPSVRELKIELGYFGTGQLWTMMDRLVRVGAIEWRKMPSGKRSPGAIRLLVPQVEPVRIPVVGYLNKSADFVPGSKWVEVYPNGSITYASRQMAIVYVPQN